MNVVDHRRFGAMSSARAHKGTVAGGAERTRTCGPAVAVCVGACASQPAALEGAGLVDHRQARRPRSERRALNTIPAE